jgi:uncharacterized membrane protein YvlD (DUF360 family)
MTSEPATARRYAGPTAREQLRVDRYVGAIGRFLLAWAVDTVSILVVTQLLDGFRIQPSPEAGTFIVAASIALVLGIANAVLRPVLVMLAMPLNAVTVGFSALFINAIVLLVVAWAYPYLVIDNLLTALLASLVLGAVNAFLTGFLPLSDDDSVYMQFVERQALKERPASASLPGRGLVAMEIDGLSYPAISQAVARGLMPHVARLLASGSHVLSHTDCGVPSMTSSCQTGILFGDNRDIPAFRWFEKAEGRMFVSNKGEDAAAMEARLSTGDGLLVGGSSIVNNQTGDAEKAFLVFSALKPRNEAERRMREQDMFLYTVNPYFFTRSVARSLWDFLVELGQIVRQTVRRVEPRINRLEKAYPLIRPPTTVFLRDLTTYLLTLDIRRGVPAMYATYLGYDEVAHHAGPGRKDALDTLRDLDDQVGKLLAAIAHAPRRYDFFLLSDHGQSLGATFKDRYGETLEALIERLTARQAVAAAAEASAGESSTYLGALMNELGGRSGVVGRALGAISQGLHRRIERDNADDTADLDPADKTIVAVSGNLACVYLDLGPPRKLTRDEVEAAHPGLIDSLVAHPGIGLTVVHHADGGATVLGKGGSRDLATGEVTGLDPLPPYGDPALRARQLARLAGFTNAGDLILISTLYPDGQVAAFEELVGSHGGLGGEQTDSFLLHPADMQVPAIENAVEVFPLLKARRALSGELAPPPAAPPAETGAWEPANLLAGLRQGRLWLHRALQCLLLQRAGYEAVTGQRRYTGPALVTALVGIVAAGLAGNAYAGEGLLGGLGSLLAELVAFFGFVLALHFAARALGGQGSFTATFRGQGFAWTVALLSLLAFIPVLADIVPPVTLALRLVALWLAVQAAHHLHGPRTLLIPLLAIGVIILVIVVGLVAAGGVAFTAEAILSRLGLEAKP